MTDFALSEPSPDDVEIVALASRDVGKWSSVQPEAVRETLAFHRFDGSPRSLIHLPGPAPRLLYGLGEGLDRWSLAPLPLTLPPANYRLHLPFGEWDPDKAVLGWAFGAYRYDGCRSPPRDPARLAWPDGADRTKLAAAVEAMNLVRDLVNAPANVLGPAELAEAARTVARTHGAECDIVQAEALIEAGYPLMHAVGAASSRPPLVIDLRWGNPDLPLVTLVGKGVCFDSGGLDLKRPEAMTLMKKDMAGGAHVLALAQLVMCARLPVRLRMLVPAVDNALAGNALRPLDVVRAGNGLAVEVVNTDAEGRLVLADALAIAARERPALLIDFATLTGAAVSALGPEIAAAITNDDHVAGALKRAAEKMEDPVWRLPLWRRYAPYLESDTADIANVPDLKIGWSSSAGAIYGALFLERFIEPPCPWLHLDIYGWNDQPTPGRAAGAEPHGLLAVFELLRARYGDGQTAAA